MAVDISLSLTDLLTFVHWFCLHQPEGIQLLMVLQGSLAQVRLTKQRLCGLLDLPLLAAIAVVGSLLLIVAVITKSPVLGAFLALSTLVAAYDLAMRYAPQLLRLSSRSAEGLVATWFAALVAIALAGLAGWLIWNVMRVLESEIGVLPFVLGMLLLSRFWSAPNLAQKVKLGLCTVLVAAFLVLESLALVRFLCWFANPT